MSTLVTSNISDGTTSVGTEYVVNGSAKAWGYKNAAGTALGDTLNVSSLTDINVGDARFNLTNAMSTVETGLFGGQGTTSYIVYLRLLTTSELRIYTYTNSGSAVDAVGYVGAMGDLA